MTMGPVCDDAEMLRPYFRATRELFDRMNEKYAFRNGGILSMGMSDSYRVAIEEGSTLVRIGRRFFEKNKNDYLNTLQTLMYQQIQALDLIFVTNIVRRYDKLQGIW